MSKKNPSVLWSVDQENISTGIDKSGKAQARKNIGVDFTDPSVSGNTNTLEFLSNVNAPDDNGKLTFTKKKVTVDQSYGNGSSSNPISATGVKTKIDSMNQSNPVDAGKYITAVNESAGIVTIDTESMVDDLTVLSSADELKPATSGSIKTYADNLHGSVELPLKIQNSLITNNCAFENNASTLTVTGANAWAEGNSTEASGDYSHAEGMRTHATGTRAHAENYDTTASGSESHAEGCNTVASGTDAHAEGSGAQASGVGSHAEGDYTVAAGAYSHAEGQGGQALEDKAHVEGYGGIAEGNASHVEGYECKTTDNGYYAHAEGTGTIASNTATHAEGYGSKASGYKSHAEGSDTIAYSESSHTEGELTMASGWAAHAEGHSTIAVGKASHAEGYMGDANSKQKFKTSGDAASGNTSITAAVDITLTGLVFPYVYVVIPSIGFSSQVSGINGRIITLSTALTSAVPEETEVILTKYGAIAYYSHIEGRSTTTFGESSHAEGSETTTTGYYAHAEGYQTMASGITSHAEGTGTVAQKDGAHAEGLYTTANENGAHAEGQRTTASGTGAHAEGYGCTASGIESHAEGDSTTASGYYSHSEGYGTTSSSLQSHAEGYRTTASAQQAHAEGSQTTASGNASHAEGSNTKATNLDSHAEGWDTTSSGNASHAEGYETIASGDQAHSEGHSSAAIGDWSHAEGHGTLAAGDLSHAEGSGDENIIYDNPVAVSSGSTQFTLPTGIRLVSAKYLVIPEYDYVSEIVASSGQTITTSAELPTSIPVDTQMILAANGAIGKYSHSEGQGTIATDYGAHAEGQSTNATNSFTHAEGFGSTASGDTAHAEGFKTIASGDNTHSEGYKTNAIGYCAHSQGGFSKAYGDYSHSEGFDTVAGDENDPVGHRASHAEGHLTRSLCGASHAEGYQTLACNDDAHAEGYSSVAAGITSHTEGGSTIAGDAYAHAEGNGSYILTRTSTATDANATTIKITDTIPSAGTWYVIVPSLRMSAIKVDSASTQNSVTTLTLHSALPNTASFPYNTEVIVTRYGALGNISHSEGCYTAATGMYSHAQGEGTKATGQAAFAAGKYNTDTNSGALFVIGNGTADNARSDCFMVNQSGDTYFNVSGTLTKLEPSSANPLMDGTASPGTATAYARADHVHPTDTTREAVSNRTTTIRAISSASDDNYPTEKAVRTELDTINTGKADKITYTITDKTISNQLTVDPATGSYPLSDRPVNISYGGGMEITSNRTGSLTFESHAFYDVYNDTSVTSYDIDGPASTSTHCKQLMPSKIFPVVKETVDGGVKLLTYLGHDASVTPNRYMFGGAYGDTVYYKYATPDTNNGNKLTWNTTQKFKTNNGLLSIDIGGTVYNTGFTANSVWNYNASTAPNDKFSFPAAAYSTSGGSTTYTAGYMSGEDKESLYTHSHGLITYDGCIDYNDNAYSTQTSDQLLVASYSNNYEIHKSASFTFNANDEINNERIAVTKYGTWGFHQTDIHLQYTPLIAEPTGDNHMLTSVLGGWLNEYNQESYPLYSIFYTTSQSGSGSYISRTTYPNICCYVTSANNDPDKSSCTFYGIDFSSTKFDVVATSCYAGAPNSVSRYTYLSTSSNQWSDFIQYQITGENSDTAWQSFIANTANATTSTSITTTWSNFLERVIAGTGSISPWSEFVNKHVGHCIAKLTNNGNVFECARADIDVHDRSGVVHYNSAPIKQTADNKFDAILQDMLLYSSDNIIYKDSTSQATSVITPLAYANLPTSYDCERFTIRFFNGNGQQTGSAWTITFTTTATHSTGRTIKANYWTESGQIYPYYQTTEMTYEIPWRRMLRLDFFCQSITSDTSATTYNYIVEAKLY